VLTYPLIAIFGIIITINVVSGLGNLFSSTPQNATSSDSPSGAVSNHTENNSNPFVGNDNSGAVPTEQTPPPPAVPVRVIEESYSFVSQPWMVTGDSETGIIYAAVFNMVRGGDLVKSVIAPLPIIATHENASNEFWEDIILKAAEEFGEIKYLLFRRCSIDLSTINKDILPDTVWCATIAEIYYNEPYREVSVQILRELDVHFAGFRGGDGSMEQFVEALKEHMGKFGVTDVVIIRSE